MKPTSTADRMLRLTRFIAAPLDNVWAAWTDPDRLPQWWGPRGFTCNTHEIDLREGGQWRFDMIGPDGAVFPNRQQFTRIAPKSAIEYSLDDGSGEHHLDAKVHFEQLETGTRVTLTMTFPDAETRTKVEKVGAVALGYTTLDCLAESATSGHSVSLTRLLPLSPEKLLPVLTEPNHLEGWFFPADVTIKASDFDPKKGGAWRTQMQAKDGTAFNVRGAFRDVSPTHTLSFTHGWEDEDGHVATTTLVTLSLEPEGTGSK